VSSVGTLSKVVDSNRTTFSVRMRGTGRYQVVIDFSSVQTDAIHHGRPRSQTDEHC